MSGTVDGRTHHDECWRNRGHHDCAIARLNALLAERERGKWISVSERLPERIEGQDFVPVLFYTPKDDRVCAGRYWREGRHRWVSLQGRGYSRAEVTYWMPLPTPPELAVQNAAGKVKP